MTPPDLSVILPAHNEVENLEALLGEIEEVLTELSLSWEVIIVDDASEDRTPAWLAAAASRDERIRSVRHHQRCGQSAAYATGFRLARAPLLLTMDSDRQHDPADFPLLWKALEPEIDCVAGYRARRQDSGLKRRASRIANGFRDWITGVPVKDAGCTFRLFRREVVEELLIFNGLHRFFVTILTLQGFRVQEVPIQHRPRTKGISKYGVNDRLWRGLRDCFALRWYRQRVFPARRFSAE